MRLGVHTETGYPLFNCTADTLKLLLSSSDPRIVRLGRYIKSKKSRPRFDVWLARHVKRRGPIGKFAKWLMAQRRDKGQFLVKFQQPPEQVVRFFERARWAGVTIPKQVQAGITEALEEWDRWEYDVSLGELETP